MSGRRPWGGYGLALGLVLSVAGCATKASPPPPEPAAPAESTVVNPEALKPTEPVVEGQDADLRVKGIKLVQDEGQSGLFVKLSRIPDTDLSAGSTAARTH